jgi:uncharacterized membrane protein YkvA (DUF1232 family)
MNRSDSPDPLLPAAASTPSRERALRTALDGAKRVLKRRFRVLLLVRDAYEHAGEYDSSMRGARTDLMALLRLLKAWALRQYERVPWPSLLLVAGAVVYFVMPVDMIPDMLPGIGFVDDVAVVSAVMHTLRDELDRFQAWERTRLVRASTAPLLVSPENTA